MLTRRRWQSRGIQVGKKEIEKYENDETGETYLDERSFFLFFFFNLCTYLFIYFSISWRLITLQYCSGFCHTLT